MTHRLRVVISGRVQGVGFRYSTYRAASSLGLNGWVKNLPDGRVEAEFEGPREDLEEMLEWCRGGPRMAYVSDVKTAWSSGEPLYTGFQVRG